MSFWDLSDGQTAADTPKDYEIPGDNFEPIPNNSDVLAIVDQAKWAEKDGNNYIELRWSIMAPEEVKNRKVFQKIWVTDLDPNAKDEAKGKEKRDKARRMLALIDANTGGNLTRTGDAPTDETMTMHLCNVPLVIKLMVWAFTTSDGSFLSGNRVHTVSGPDKPLQISKEPLPKASAAPAARQGGSGSRDLDDEIPF